MCIYIYIERERDRERERGVYIYIYIYITIPETANVLELRHKLDLRGTTCRASGLK